MKFKTVDSYPKEFENKYPLLLFNNVIRDFFRLISIEILKGYKFQLNPKIGNIKIVREERKSKGLKVDFGKTRANKKKGINEVVYRTNEYMDKFVWNKSSIDETLQLFKFKATYHNNRNIPKYDEFLSISTLEFKKETTFNLNSLLYNKWNKENTLVQKQ